jgi:predicted DCC family thiol-disulfide oxidoreductase YuxK
MKEGDGIVEWDGEERRNCIGCRNLDSLERRVNQCKAQFDAEIIQVHESVAGLNKEIHGLRSDMSASVGEINKSLADIAATLRQLADLPEAWRNLKGFMAVVRWTKENLLLLAIMGAVVIYAIKSFGLAP